MAVAGHDLVVIGGGLAGLTAGLFAARLGLDVLVLEAAVPGGAVVNLERIEDFPGFPQGVVGYELGPSLQEQAAEAGAAFAMGTATGLALDGEGWVVVCDGESYAGRALVVATGTRPRGLGLAGEERLHGRGISHCASCDGPLHRGKTVGVVGGGSAALHEALALTAFASEVYLLSPGEPDGDAVYRRRIDEDSRVKVRTGVAVAELLGENALSGVRLAGGEVLELAGLFVYVGNEPNTELLRGVVPLTASGHVRTDARMRTDAAGVLAAGSVRAEAAGYAVCSAGDGATAAKVAYDYLRERSWR